MRYAGGISPRRDIRALEALLQPATASGLSEQQRIADAFFAEHLIPAKLDTTVLKIWTPKGP
jgi:hypothetical protein